MRVYKNRSTPSTSAFHRPKQRSKLMNSGVKLGCTSSILLSCPLNPNSNLNILKLISYLIGFLLLSKINTKKRSKCSEKHSQGIFAGFFLLNRETIFWGFKSIKRGFTDVKRHRVKRTMVKNVTKGKTTKRENGKKNILWMISG